MTFFICWWKSFISWNGKSEHLGKSLIYMEIWTFNSKFSKFLSFHKKQAQFYHKPNPNLKLHSQYCHSPCIMVIALVDWIYVLCKSTGHPKVLADIINFQLKSHEAIIAIPKVLLIKACSGLIFRDKIWDLSWLTSSKFE